MITRRSESALRSTSWMHAVVALTAIVVATVVVRAQGGVTPLPTGAPVGAASELASAFDSIERKVIDGVNSERGAQGLPALAVNAELGRIARAYSREMAERGFFGHTDPDGRTVKERVGPVAWTNIGENIARNKGFTDPGDVAVREWMKSEGHRHNILESRFVETGVGVWIAGDRTVYFTQIFFTKADDEGPSTLSPVPSAP